MHRIARNRLAAALVVCLALTGSAVSTRAQDSEATTAAKLRDAALKDGWGYRFLEGLTTEIGQRLAGTPAEASAAV